MDEYIKRKPLIEEISSLSVTLCGNEIFGTLAKQSVVKRIYEQPAADVMEVVRCGDCIYEDTTSCPLCYIEKHTLQFINHDGAFYCAKGERKDGVGE